MSSKNESDYDDRSSDGSDSEGSLVDFIMKTEDEDSEDEDVESDNDDAALVNEFPYDPALLEEETNATGPRRSRRQRKAPTRYVDAQFNKLMFDDVELDKLSDDDEADPANEESEYEEDSEESDDSDEFDEEADADEADKGKSSKKASRNEESSQAPHNDGTKSNNETNGKGVQPSSRPVKVATSTSVEVVLTADPPIVVGKRPASAHHPNHAGKKMKL